MKVLKFGVPILRQDNTVTWYSAVLMATGKFHSCKFCCKLRVRIRVVVFIDEEKPHSFRLNFEMHVTGWNLPRAVRTAVIHGQHYSVDQKSNSNLQTALFYKILVIFAMLLRSSCILTYNYKYVYS